MRRHHRQLLLTALEDRLAPAVLCVAPDGVDAAGRGTPDTPFRSLQYAVNQAFGGDTILAAAGTYTYDAAASAGVSEPETRQVVTVSNKKLALYGGYSRADRYAVSNPSANATAIDGQGQYRGVYVAGRTAETALDLQGFTIRNGLAAPRPGGQQAFSNSAYGGGLYIDMANTAFSKASTTPFILNNLTFENNTSRGTGPTGQPDADTGGAGSGGAIFSIYGNDVRISNVVFRNNTAEGGNGTGGRRGGVALGGAIHTNFSKLTVTNSLFDGNKALSGVSNPAAAGLPFYADATGGAIALQLSSVGTFTNVGVTNNQAIGGADIGGTSGHGGNAYGGGIFTEIDTQLTMTDSVVSGNLAQGGDGFTGADAGGGGIETDNSDLNLYRVKVTGNRVVGGGPGVAGGTFGAPTGGGIYSFRTGSGSPRGTVNIFNSLIAGNSVETDPAFTGDVAFGSGAGARFNGTTTTVSHTTFSDNAFSRGIFYGQGIMLQNDGSPVPTTLNLEYSILANHNAVGSNPITLFRGTSANLNTNLFFNNFRGHTTDSPDNGSGPNSNTPGVATGTNTNLLGDPLFGGAGDYGIAAGGAAADAAAGSTEALDLGNTPRAGVPDVGAYEVGTSGSLPATPAPTGSASNTGTGSYDSFPASPPPPPTVGSPVLVGFPQFAVGADSGGGSGLNLYNPDLSVRTGGFAFADTTFTGGVRTATADYNGDGVADLVVGTGPGSSTRVRVLDGVDRRVIADFAPFEAAFKGGVYVAAGDITGDGVPDIVVTPDEGGGPRCRIYNGRGFDSAIVADFYGIDDPNFRGGARAAIGDVNGDAFGDLIVAAGFQGGPRVAGFSGKALAAGSQTRVFGDFYAFEQALRNGIFVAAGDLDGDGYAEVICGGGPGGGPRVTAFSGKNLLANSHTVTANFFGGDDSSRGGIRVAVKNLDGDNRADVLVGAGSGAGSRVTGYFGKNIPLSGPPAQAFAFDAFPGFAGGVFVG